MKTKTLLICTLIAILTIAYACEKISPEDSLIDVHLPFTLTDSLGNDLFFDENSPYDPYDVELLSPKYGSRSWSFVDSSRFYITGLRVSHLPTLLMYFSFFPDRIDLVTIEAYNEGGKPHSYLFNAFFNSDTICIKCNEYYHGVYEIKTEIP